MPLTFDLPWDQLQQYAGSTPRPDDFDEYWASGLAELDRLDLEPEIHPADFDASSARCEHLFFRGTGGARIHAKLVRPQQPPQQRPQQPAAPKPAVLMFHGYGGESRPWVELLPYAAEGCTVAALDVRGQAGLSDDVTSASGWTLRSHLVRGLVDGPEHLLFRHVFLDTVALARIVAGLDGVDPARMAATGASQGGGLTLACAALFGQLRLAAPIYPFLSDYRRAWELSLRTDPYHEITDWFRHKDPRHERADEMFTRLGYVDVQHLAPRIRADVMFYVGLEDKTCPPSTQFAAYNKISAPKQLRSYPDYGHEPLPGAADEIFSLVTNL